MTVNTANTFFWGGSAVASWAIGLFFLRFWRQTHDRFFAILAGAFWLLAGNWVGLGLTDPLDETRTLFYVLRILAHVAIAAAIVDKSLSSHPA